LPSDLKWSNIIGVGFLGGIGFTMSVFVTLLAFEGDSLINASKIAILSASIIAGGIGFIWLRLTLSNSFEDEESHLEEDNENDIPVGNSIRTSN
jgi:NhaA family Na+:H+ antiporter